jgi:hypothetical protein
MTSAKKDDPASAGWVEFHSGYEYTRSEATIRYTLNWLKEKRIYVTLYHKGYQSGGTVVVAVSDQRIDIDRPRDWPATHTAIRVIFRNAAKLWTHFNGEVVSAAADTLFLRFPQELFVLQRRQHFRINLPEGSTATFLYNQKKCKLNMQDLSTGGMLLCTKSQEEMPQQNHTIKNICLTIPCEEAAADADNGVLHFKIKEAEVVRTFTNSKLRLFCLGVKFAPSRTEEDRILRYIRQRELMQLRKGVQEE